MLEHNVRREKRLMSLYNGKAVKYTPSLPRGSQRLPRGALNRAMPQRTQQPITARDHQAEHDGDSVHVTATPLPIFNDDHRLFLVAGALLAHVRLVLLWSSVAKKPKHRHKHRCTKLRLHALTVGVLWATQLACDPSIDLRMNPYSCRP